MQILFFQSIDLFFLLYSLTIKLNKNTDIEARDIMGSGTSIFSAQEIDEYNRLTYLTVPEIKL